MIILSVKCYCGTSGVYRDIPLMKVSVRWDSENSLKIVIVLLKSGLLATMEAPQPKIEKAIRVGDGIWAGRLQKK